MINRNHSGEVVEEIAPDTLLSVAQSPVEHADAETREAELEGETLSTPDVQNMQQEEATTEASVEEATQEQVLQKEVGGSEAQEEEAEDEAENVPEEPVQAAPGEEVDETLAPAIEAAEAVADATTLPATAEDGVAPAPEQVDAPAAEDGETQAASFTPVETDDVRPRRLKDLEVGMELEGRVTSIALYGIFVDLGVGRDGLVHISEMSNTRINSPSDLVQIGDSVQVRVKALDPEARRISLTMRQPRERERDNEEERRARKRQEINHEALTSLKVGDSVEGTVTGLSSFGVFVDIGVGKDGLVHISELAEGRVEKPEDAVQVGQSYTFKLLEVDPEGSRISLSLRRAQRLQKMRELSPGQVLEGVVSGLAPFGAFVDIGVGRDGLVHISQLSDKRVGKVEDVVKVGDKVSVRVLEVDPQSKRISLTMRSEESLAAEEEAGEEISESPAAVASLAPVEQPARPPREESRRDDDQRNRRRSSGRSQRTTGAATQPAGDASISVGDDSDEEFEGNATLEDLISKFGGAQRKNQSRRRRTEETPEEEEEDDRVFQRQKQRDAIRRTLRRDDEEG